MFHFILSVILLGTPSIDQQRPVQMDLSLMYRKSGHTAKWYRRINEGDTLHYYKRQGNPYFRVYGLRMYGAKFLEVNTESYEGSKMVKKAKAYTSSQAGQFVDTYLNEKEDLVVVKARYMQNNREKVFTFYIIPDLPLD